MFISIFNICELISYIIYTYMIQGRIVFKKVIKLPLHNYTTSWIIWGIRVYVSSRNNNNLGMIWDYYTDWSPPIHPHNWTVWNPRCIARKLYPHSKSSGASSLCWLGRSRGKLGNCRGHSAVEARAENPQFLRSQSTPRLICMVRHTNNTFSWPQKCYDIRGKICLIVELYFVIIYLVNQ